MELEQFLRAAWSNIDEPHKWTRGVSRRETRHDDWRVDVQFCSIGAMGFSGESHALRMRAAQALSDTLRRVGADPRTPDGWSILFTSERQNVMSSVICYNDSHTHAQVRRLWLATIENERRGGVEQRNRDRRIRQQVIVMREGWHDWPASEGWNQPALAEMDA